MSDALNMSLDQIAAARRAANPGRTGGGRGKGRGGGGGGGKFGKVQNNRRENRRDTPYQSIKSGGRGLTLGRRVTNVNVDAAPQTTRPASSSSIFSRLGTNSGDATVVFSNLVSTVESNDMSELCSSIGEIKEISLKMFPSTGKKSAEVVFSRQEDAVACVDKFNGLTLDGVIMEVTMGGSNSAKPTTSLSSAAFRATQSAPYMQQEENKPMTKSTLFGSALGSGSQTTSFKVTLTGGPPENGGFTGRNVSSGSGGGRGGGRGRGGARGRGGGRDRPRRENPKTAEDLDAELDNWRVGTGEEDANGDEAPKVTGVRRKGKKAIEPEDLDADMDEYFAAKK